MVMVMEGGETGRGENYGRKEMREGRGTGVMKEVTQD